MWFPFATSLSFVFKAQAAMEPDVKLKTILAVPFFSINLTGATGTGHSVGYAAEMARSQGAHLIVAVAVVPMRVSSAFLSTAKALVQDANRELEEQARQFADKTAAGFNSQEFVGEVNLIADDFDDLCRQLLILARTADVIIMHPEDTILSLQQNLLETMLFDSGRPIIVTPQTWGGSALPERIVVSWDGSAKSARAVGDALPLLQQAREVEIVSVTGDPNKTKCFENAGIARHLSRHCKSVTVKSIVSVDGDIAKTLGDHALITNADMLVMGAYAHSRLRQLILGGVTDAMIHNPPLPVFMSY